MKVTHARTGTLEADLPNKRILMHVFGARYQQRDDYDPFDLNRMRDGISVEEGTLPDQPGGALREGKKTGQPFDALSRAADGAVGQRRSEDAQLEPDRDQQTFSFPDRLHRLCPRRCPLGITAHRRETSFGFAASLVIGVFYFLFIIVADTLRTNPKLHPELLVWFPNLLFIVLGDRMFRRLSKR